MPLLGNNQKQCLTGGNNQKQCLTGETIRSNALRAHTQFCAGVCGREAGFKRQLGGRELWICWRGKKGISNNCLGMALWQISKFYKSCSLRQEALCIEEFPPIYSKHRAWCHSYSIVDLWRKILLSFYLVIVVSKQLAQTDWYVVRLRFRRLALCMHVFPLFLSFLQIPLKVWSETHQSKGSGKITLLVIITQEARDVTIFKIFCSIIVFICDLFRF